MGKPGFPNPLPEGRVWEGEALPGIVMFMPVGNPGFSIPPPTGWQALPTGRVWEGAALPGETLQAGDGEPRILPVVAHTQVIEATNVPDIVTPTAGTGNCAGCGTGLMQRPPPAVGCGACQQGVRGRAQPSHTLPAGRSAAKPGFPVFLPALPCQWILHHTNSRSGIILLPCLTLKLPARPAPGRAVSKGPFARGAPYGT